MSSERPPTNEEKTGRSFQGQMMGSIQQRLAKEKADRLRFASEREKVSKDRHWAFSVGKSFA
jgi:D-lactate dehydrogenase (cytochrome)